MRIAFGKKLCGIQRAPLLDNAVHEEMIFAPEQDHVPAAHILDGDPPDHGDILRPHPWLHAGAVNAMGIFYRILDAPEECARFLYERRGAALQTPPWPGSLPHASANVS